MRLCGSAFWAGLSFTVLACGGNAQEHRVIATDGGRSPGGAAAVSGQGGRGGAAGVAAGGVAQGGAEDGGASGAGGTSCGKTADNSASNLELISLSITCTAADGDTGFTRLTPDARYVAFDSDADDLVAGDVNGKSDGFLFDRETRTLELISKKYGGDEPADGYTSLLVPSDDARYVAFTSLGYELTEMIPPDGIWIYLRDRQRATTERYPADYACTYWLDMSGDGHFMVAEGFTNCQGGRDDGDYDSTIEYDVLNGESRAFGATDGSDNYSPSISRDGRFVVWASRAPMMDGQPTAQLNIYDRMTDTVETVPHQGIYFGYTDISDSGEIVAFAEYGLVYRYDRVTEELTNVSLNALGELGDGSHGEISLSGDGRYLVFRSTSTNLVEGDTNGVADIFLHDANTGMLERISMGPDGSEADDESKSPYISGDGTAVSFASKARNLLPAARSGNWQLYVRTRAP